MAKVFNLRAPTGKYKDEQGEERTRWVQIGVVFEKDGRLSGKMESIPVGWDGWFSLLPPQDNDGESRPQGGQRRSAPAKSAPASTGGGFDDDLGDVPF